MQSNLSPLPCAKIVPGQPYLTQEQEAYIDQELKVQGEAMLSCEPVDEAQAEAHLRDAYRVAGLHPPRIRWFDSPHSFAISYSYIKEVYQGKIVPRKEWDDVWCKVVTDVIEDWSKCPGYSQLQEEVLFQMYIPNERYVAMMESIEYFLERGIWLFMNDRETVADDYYYYVKYKGWTYGGALQDSIMCAASNAYHYHDASAFQKILGDLLEPGPAIHFALFNRMVSGYVLGPEEAWLIRKPVRLEFDEQDRLHSASGMCIQYRDGEGFYGWHGMHVPEWVIMQQAEDLSKYDWLALENLEVRRALQERIGTEQFLSLMEAVCIDRGKRGSLWSVDLKDDFLEEDEVVHYVQVQDSSSARAYFLRVPPTLQRADEAVAWTFGLTEETYHPGQET